MTIAEIIHQRRSLRPECFTDQKVDSKHVEAIIHAANAAPSHKKTYPWRFVALESEQSRKDLGEYLATKKVENSQKNISEPKLRITRERPLKSPIVLVIIMKPDLDKLPEWEEVSATAAAVQNMWLALTELGLAGYWSSPKTLTTGAESFLGLATGEKCLGLFYLGHPNTEPGPIQRPSVQEKLSWK